MILNIFERGFWTREAFFAEALAGWILLANGCIWWYPPVYVCGAVVVLAALFMVGEDE